MGVTWVPSHTETFRRWVKSTLVTLDRHRGDWGSDVVGQQVHPPRRVEGGSVQVLLLQKEISDAVGLSTKGGETLHKLLLYVKNFRDC